LKPTSFTPRGWLCRANIAGRRPIALTPKCSYAFSSAGSTASLGIARWWRFHLWKRKMSSAPAVSAKTSSASKREVLEAADGGLRATGAGPRLYAVEHVVSRARRALSRGAVWATPAPLPPGTRVLTRAWRGIRVPWRPCYGTPRIADRPTVRGPPRVLEGVRVATRDVGYYVVDLNGVEVHGGYASGITTAYWDGSAWTFLVEDTWIRTDDSHVAPRSPRRDR
jgi:hypothetical protein